MEIDNGSGGQPCCLGSSDAGIDGDIVGHSSYPGLAHAPRCVRRISFSGESLDFGMGNGVDMGAARACPRISRARCGQSGSNMGRRRMVGAAPPFLSMVVTEQIA